MPVSNRKYIGIMLAALMVFALGGLFGCSPAATPAPALPTPTNQPVQAETAYPAQEEAPVTQATAYPGAQEAPTMPAAGEAYPPPGGPGGAPAVENRSQITARLISQAPAEDLPDMLKLHIQVLSTREVAGMPSFTNQLSGQEIDLYAPSAGFPAIQPGENLEAEVTYRGDENGGRYIAQSVSKAAQ